MSGRSAATLVGHRRLVLFAGLALIGALLPPAVRLGERLVIGAALPDSESAAVEAALRERFESPYADHLVVVASGLPTAEQGGDRLLREIVAEALRVPGVTRTFSRLDRPDPFFSGPGGSFVLVGLESGGVRSEDRVAPLREAMSRLGPRHAAATGGRLNVTVTGAPAFNFDLRQRTATETRRAEALALPLSLGLLVFAQGAVGAALAVLVPGTLAIVCAFGALSAIAAQVPISTLAQSMASMLGLGLGIDYGLLIVGRFRDARASGLDEATAVVAAARAASGTVILSGATVAIGLAAMLIVPLGEIRSLAVGGLCAVAFAVLFAAGFLPALLAVGGRVTEWGCWFRDRDCRRQGWRRVGRMVVSRPAMAFACATIPVLVLSAQALRLSDRLPESAALPATMESVLGARALGHMNRGGVPLTLRVLLELPADTSALGRIGWDATARAARAIAADARVGRVQALPTLAGQADLAAVSLAPSAVKRQFVSLEGDAALLQVVPRDGVGINELVALVHELRAADAASLSGLRGTRLRVGGLPAFNADYKDRLTGWLGPLVALVALGTSLATFTAFRSVLVPLKALGLNLLAVSAAFGAAVLVFQEGHGAAWLGLGAPLHGMYPAIPLLVFCTVFGLSMDYEVFLVARVAEAHRAGLDDAAAVVEALAATGPTITTAAGVMVVVFGAFASGELVLVKLLGFTLAVAVVLDATVLRLAAGPALLVLAGRWNWWPGERGRVETGR